MKPMLLTTFLLVAGCTDPTLSTSLVIGTDGVSVSPTLSGQVGNATVYVQP